MEDFDHYENAHMARLFTSTHGSFPWAFQESLLNQFGGQSDKFDPALIDVLYNIWREGVLYGANGKCSRPGCPETNGVDFIGSMTAYVATKEEPHPNQPMLLCPGCAEEYTEHWQERWDDYYAGCM